MIKARNYIIVLFLIIFINNLGYSQDWKTDMLALNKTYLNAVSFSMDVLIESYEKASDLRPSLSYKGKVAKQKENYFTYMLDKTTILNKRCLIVVDDSQKLVLYKNTKNQKNPVSNLISLSNLDSLVTLATKDVDVKYLATNNNEKTIQIAYKMVKGSKVEVVMNTLTNTLIQMIYYSEELIGKNKVSTKTVVKYSNIKLNEYIPDELFSEKKYIDRKLGGITLSKRYTNYKLMNESK